MHDWMPCHWCNAPIVFGEAKDLVTGEHLCKECYDEFQEMRGEDDAEDETEQPEEET